MILTATKLHLQYTRNISSLFHTVDCPEIRLLSCSINKNVLNTFLRFQRNETKTNGTPSVDFKYLVYQGCCLR